nr:MAG TPA: hypothetical protein [Caudoviricetes sp.]
MGSVPRLRWQWPSQPLLRSAACPTLCKRSTNASRWPLNYSR